MYDLVAGFRSRVLTVCALSVLLCAACGSTEPERFVEAGSPDDPALDLGAAGAGTMEMEIGSGSAATGLAESCDRISMSGEGLLENEVHFTATFRLGEGYTRTVMLFGGESYEEDIIGNGYFFGLDKADAEVLAMKYPDFYLCSSPGGMEAMEHIIPYDFVPANCEIYGQIMTALADYDENVVKGGDRTSLQFDGVPLELESVIDDGSGQDVTDMVSGQSFHLITKVQQLTGESVLDFGTSP